MRSALHFLGRLAPLSVLALAAAPLFACQSELNDPPADAGTPTALGSGSRIAEIMNPALAPPSGTVVSITGATFLLVDSYDETADGKSQGTVYLEDVPPVSVAAPYSGTALYDPTYLPSSLEPAPGDVLDLVGAYDVEASLGTAVFSAGTGLVQIYKPVVKPRFEYKLPAPLLITASSLDGTYDQGLQSESMLATIENVTFPDNMICAGTCQQCCLSSNAVGRYTIHISPDTSEDAPTLDNELFDVATWNKENGTPLAAGKTIKSVTGIVTWFFNFHIAPRSAADIVVQ
jgi:hypothetical protein